MSSGPRVPYRLDSGNFCEYERDCDEPSEYVRLGDVVSLWVDTPFGETDWVGELCAVQYSEDGFLETCQIAVDDDRCVDVICDGTFYRPSKGSGSSDGH